MSSHLIGLIPRSIAVMIATTALAAALDAGPQTPPQNASAPAPVILTPGPSAARTPTNAEEFDAYFKKISNWGRWGASDELGALNLDYRRQAAAGGSPRAQRSGRRPGAFATHERDLDNGSPFEHTMNRGFTTDIYRVMYHGYAHSHMDTLCHILYKDQTYNGYARADVNTEQGCTKLGIHNFRNGYVTRGILMDIPRLKGVPYLEPGTPIFVEDLEAWEKRAGMKVSPGDALLISTGRWARRAARRTVERRSERRRTARVGWRVAEGSRRRAHRQRRGARRRAVARARRSTCPSTRSRSPRWA